MLLLIKNKTTKGIKMSKQVTGKQLAIELQKKIMDLPSETLFEVNNLLGLYKLYTFDHVQDIFTIYEGENE
jgi:hypothetical protein